MLNLRLRYQLQTKRIENKRSGNLSADKKSQDFLANLKKDR
jgi:hypothetical protein